MWGQGICTKTNLTLGTTFGGQASFESPDTPPQFANYPEWGCKAVIPILEIFFYNHTKYYVSQKYAPNLLHEG